MLFNFFSLFSLPLKRFDCLDFHMRVGCYTVSTGDGKSQIDFSLLLKRFHFRSYNQLFESNKLTFKVVVFPTCAHTVK